MDIVFPIIHGLATSLNSASRVCTNCLLHKVIAEDPGSGTRCKLFNEYFRTAIAFSKLENTVSKIIAYNNSYHTYLYFFFLHFSLIYIKLLMLNMAGIILLILTIAFYIPLFIFVSTSLINGTYMNKKILLHIIARDNILPFHCPILRS